MIENNSVTADQMSFRADCDFGSSLTNGLPEKPITITARTSAEAHQGYWGRCVHDLAGFRMPTKSIPLDSAHNSDTAIGFANEFTVADNKITTKAVLTPFKADDSASEIIFKASKGVPYQASIVMDPNDLDFEQVPEGKTVAVNGGTFTGPGTVFRKWGINGIAILPYGADSTTSVQFSRGTTAIVPRVLKDQNMTDPVIAPAPAAAGIVPPVVPPVENVVAENPDNFSRSKALKFTTDFGDQGFRWCLEGKTYEEASLLFTADLKAKSDAAIATKDAEIAALKTERDAFKAKAEFRRGQSSPVPVKPTDPPAEKEKPNPANFGRTAAMQTFVEAIQARMHTHN